MPAIQAMRSDALALKSQEDVKEKVPSFINSVNQALGQSIVQGQDNAEQIVKSRFEAANKIAAEIRQKLDAKSGFSEIAVGMATKFGGLISQTVSAAFSKSDNDRWLKLSTAVTAFGTEATGLAYQWKSAVASYVQWTTQAGYTGNGTGDADYLSDPTGGDAEKRLWSMGGRGAIKYRDALTPRYTDRSIYVDTAGGYTGNYDTWYAWGSVGSITRIGQYNMA